MYPHEHEQAGHHALLASAELQDDLLVVLNDLERLQGLLDDSHAALQGGFFGLVDSMPPGHADGADTQRHVANAVKALQFQDMATQLIAHTAARLRHRADRLALAAFVGDGDGADEEPLIAPLPQRPNPVTQAEMDTGFVELF
jgi:hypothetical protein